MTVAVDTRITPELRKEGIARELSRAVQNLRKKSGLAVSDRIHLGIEGPDEVSAAIESHLDWLASETLAISVAQAPVDAPGGRTDVTVDGYRITISIRRA
jgi:isoleucyl-tRNA synthetase